MLVSEIATRVKRQFGDEAGAQITDADIMRWINDAQREIAANNDLLQATATSNIVAGTDQYNLPTDVLTLRSVRYNGRRLALMTADEAANYVNQDTAKSSGEPTAYSLWGLKIDLYPTPAAALVGGLSVAYTKIPTQVTALGDTPELPQQYHGRIVEYCLAQAHELDDNMESYQAKMNQFQDGMDRMKGMDAPDQIVYGGISTSIADAGDGGYYG